jgi:phytoene dehydrogenase-like protein
MKRTNIVGIVGAGLSGLAAGIHLARNGYRARIFEANDKVGGCCATTQVDGFTFNDGALYLALPGLLDTAFAKLGLERAQRLPLRRIVASRTTHLADGRVVTIADGRVRIEGASAARQSEIDTDIAALMHKWQPAFQLFAEELLPYPFSLARLFAKGWRHLPKFRGTVADELAATIRDPAARAALSGMLLYTGLPPERTPVFQIVGLVALLGEGFFLPEAGMGAVAETLRAAFIEAGGEILTNSPVAKIGVSNGRAASLFVPAHGHFVVDAVVSSVSGMLTASLVDPAVLPEKMRRHANDAPLSQKALCVQLGLANRIDAASHSVSMLPPMEDQAQFFEPTDGEPRWFTYSVPTVTMPELAPAGGSIIEMFPAIDQGTRADDWSEAARNEVAEKAIRALSRHHDLDIVTRRIMSPRDYRERMHLVEGAVYGLSPAADARSQFPHRTQLPGLFQAGQTTYPGYGVATSILSGIFAAQALAKKIH